MKRYASILLLTALLLGSCSHRVQSVHVKKKKPISTGQTFLMVGCFMLGYGLTNEYLIEK